MADPAGLALAASSAEEEPAWLRRLPWLVTLAVLCWDGEQFSKPAHMHCDLQEEEQEQSAELHTAARVLSAALRPSSSTRDDFSSSAAASQQHPVKVSHVAVLRMCGSGKLTVMSSAVLHPSK